MADILQAVRTLPTIPASTAAPDRVSQRVPGSRADLTCTSSLFLYDGDRKKGKERLPHPLPCSRAVFFGTRLDGQSKPASHSMPPETRKRPLEPSVDERQLPPPQRQKMLAPLPASLHEPSPEAQVHNAPPPQPPVFHSTNKPTDLVIGSYNLAGAQISLERFSSIVRTLCALSQPPSLIALGEFKPTGAPLSAFQASATLHSHGRYYLIASPGAPTDGIALLISPDLTHSGPPQFEVIVPHRVIVFRTHIFPSNHIPPVSFVAVYGSSRHQDRFILERALAPFLQENAVICGDLNAISFLSDASGLSAQYANSLVWPWLARAEETERLVDCVRHLTNGNPPKTRVRGYSGASYLDRIMLSRSLFNTATPSAYSVAPLLIDGVPHGDHDLVLVHLLPWGWEVQRPRLCQGWGKHHIRRYQKALESNPHLTSIKFDELGPPEQIQACVLLGQTMLDTMQQVNADKPVRPRAQEMSWHQHVRSLLRLARRNHSCFFRRVRHDLLLPMLKPRIPLAPETLLKLVQTSNPWDPDCVSQLPDHPSSPSIPLPTDDELLRLSRTPRAKSPGPDGIPPYLIYTLPHSLFHWFAQGIRLSLQLQHILPHFLNSTLIGIFKNKERWWEPSSWRPICMATAPYRIAARFLKGFLLASISRHIHPHQYGGLPGRTTASATLRVQELMHQSQDPRFLLLLDISNAFSSTPFPVLMSLIRKAGVPEQIVNLVDHLCQHGVLFLPGDLSPHRASSGARQGCPLSPLLFLVVFDPVLHALNQHHPTAFMDDLALILPSLSTLRTVGNQATLFLSRLGLQINWPKCEWLAVGVEVPPDPIAMIAQHAIPPEGWLIQEPPQGSELPDPKPFPGRPLATTHSAAASTHVLHLGHILTPSADPASTLQILQPLQLKEVHAYQHRPIPVYGRLKVLNQILIPRFIYQLECLPPSPGYLTVTMSSLEKFILGTIGIPAFLCKKTLYSHNRAGLGMQHLENRVLTRLLDNVHKTAKLWSVTAPGHPTAWCKHLLSEAAMLLGASTLGRVVTHQASISPFLNRNQPNPHAMPGFDCPYTPTTHRAPVSTGQVFTDGSFDPATGEMGSSVLLPNGQAAILKPPGKGSSYVAELFALALGALLCPPASSIFSDSQGALAAVRGSSPRVFHSALVNLCRTTVSTKCLQLHHVKGHNGDASNEEADRLAKVAAQSLPQPPPQPLRHPLDVSFFGRLQSPPHKTWTRHLLPTHQHESISPISWIPLRKDLKWLRWNLGCVCAPGFSHPKGYWFNEPSPNQCQWCLTTHNQSVHGMLACPAPSNPLVGAWVQAWGAHRGISQQWRAQASPRDIFLLGKLVIPTSLHGALKDSLGARSAKASIHTFQRNILQLLQPLLPTFTPAQKAAFKKRPNPWDMSDWLPPPI